MQDTEDRKNEYEVVTHNKSQFHIFLVNMLYRTTHTHKDYEISCILDGEVSVMVKGAMQTLHAGDFFLVNPYESHRMEAAAPSLILSLQISPDFFRPYFPGIENIGFSDPWIRTDQKERSLFHCICEIAVSWFRHEKFHEMRCIQLINQLFYDLFLNYGYVQQEEKDLELSRMKGMRMRKLIRYIDLHYTEKLLLSELAELENLSLHYLSHFFRDSFGMSFQDYLSRIRCEHARQLLLLSDYKLLDISMSCGFSDPKYFNKAFRKIFGCSPKEYRAKFEQDALSTQQEYLLTTQKFLSEKTGLILLDRYYRTL